ncbi:ATP-dependent DNA ligase [Streptomyces fagopyri]|uniref:ATP-dependent DNA ligase n=1 Tax=Streptomyces fagopyri TaxID=2662397 RepID=UPI0033E76A12
MKWDGYRALLSVDSSRVQLVSRQGTDLRAAFPEIVAGAAQLADGTAVDGEIVVWEDGRLAFGRLQHRMQRRGTSTRQAAAETWPAHFVAFDLLRLNGTDTTAWPYTAACRLRRGSSDGTGQPADRARPEEFPARLEWWRVRRRRSRLVGYVVASVRADSRRRCDGHSAYFCRRWRPTRRRGPALIASPSAVPQRCSIVPFSFPFSTAAVDRRRLLRVSGNRIRRKVIWRSSEGGRCSPNKTTGSRTSSEHGGRNCCGPRIC